jgi:hypothetical protein
MTRVEHSWQHVVNAPPERVFPLLCPVREREWVPGWNATVIHSASGFAEPGCVFVTDVPGRGRATWIVTSHEPPRHVAFAVFHGDYVERLEVDVARGESGSSVRWSRSYTALSPAGDAQLASACGPELDARMQRLMRALDHFCRTGTQLAAS